VVPDCEPRHGNVRFVVSVRTRFSPFSVNWNVSVPATFKELANP